MDTSWTIDEIETALRERNGILGVDGATTYRVTREEPNGYRFHLELTGQQQSVPFVAQILGDNA